MNKIKLTQQDLEFIEYHKDSVDNTKFTLKRLQTIWNTFKSQPDNYCMCTNTERKEYKLAFYVFWSNLGNQIKKLDGTI